MPAEEWGDSDDGLVDGLDDDNLGEHKIDESGQGNDAATQRLNV